MTMADYKNALITGASSGLGRGLALALARRGVHVIAAARRRQELEIVAAEITQAGGSAEVMLLDCADADATHAAVRALDERLSLDLVVANAGWGHATPAKRIDWPTVKKIFDVNVQGAVATLCGALPGMVARNRGHLVGVASLAGFRGLPKSAAYSASKSAVIAFLESLRVDLRSTAVDVTTICPGYVKTELTANRPYRMPFLMELDDGVEAMVRGIERRDAVCAFPLPLYSIVRALPLLPNTLYDFIAARSKARG
jgi:short-subunit dehydrogenase